MAIDVRQLAADRPAPSAPPPRRLLTRYLLPGLLLVSFAGLCAFALRESLAPAREVTVVPVLTGESDQRQAEGEPLFRAAGWVEPRPTPTLVPALTEGIVDRLLVVEGQEVKKDDVIARLVDTDARLGVEAAEADIQLRQAEVDSANAGLKAAKVRLEAPVHHQADLAEAESTLARVERELAAVPAMLRSANARHQLARQDWESKRQGGVAPEVTVARAASELESAAAAVEELKTRQVRLPAEVEALRRRRDALKDKLERKTDEVRQLAEAEAAVKAARARLRQADLALEGANLRLRRMAVRSSIDGRVLALAARPGQRLSGPTSAMTHDSSTVVLLYDPASLQVRVDVRLEDVGRVRPGQAARIETAALPGVVLEGETLFATSQADVQKNTLSVKVAVRKPPAGLKPDMLCQVTFLAPPQTRSSGEPGPRRLLVPRQLVEGSGDEARVWLADRVTNRARLRAVKLGRPAGELIEVASGLTADDKLIVGGRDGLADGDRIRITGEDGTLGISR